MINIAVLIVAGGSGTRLGGDIPKQYLPLNGKMILRQTIEAFLAVDPAFIIQVVIRPEDQDLYDQAVQGLFIERPVFGGADRQASVLKGLQALSGKAPTFVLIHDAARPFVTPAVIQNVLEVLTKSGPSKGVIPAIPVVDTLKKSNIDQTVAQTVSRDHLWLVQTPQGFCFQTILAAHLDQKGGNATDDAGLLEAQGIPVQIVLGEAKNTKITTQDDYERVV